MGTRALIHIKDEGLKSGTLVTIFKHWDGGLDCLGMTLAEFIKDAKISNGVQNGCYNGMGCFAAYLIKQLKDCIGDVSIVLPDTEDWGEEFTYTIYKNASAEGDNVFASNSLSMEVSEDFV